MHEQLFFAKITLERTIIMYDYELYKTSNVYNFKLIAFIIALAATIIIYFVFMDKRNKASYSNPLKDYMIIYTLIISLWNLF